MTTNSESCLEIDVELLNRAQAYLQSLLRSATPDSMLTRAWQDFYHVYSPIIRRFVIRFGVRGADVDDCVQDVWSEVVAKLGRFQRRERCPGILAWFYRVARSKAANLLRSKDRNTAGSLDAAVQAGNEPRNAAPDPGALYEQRWNRALMKTLLEDLRAEVSEMNYRVLRMRLLEGRSVAEVAALNLTPQQVHYRQHRMLRKLRARFAVHPGGHLAPAPRIETFSFFRNSAQGMAGSRGLPLRERIGLTINLQTALNSTEQAAGTVFLRHKAIARRTDACYSTDLTIRSQRNAAAERASCSVFDDVMQVSSHPCVTSVRGTRLGYWPESHWRFECVADGHGVLAEYLCPEVCSLRADRGEACNRWRVRIR